jgi:HAD superfamily hydrolase (TIGR01484 family)
MVRLLGRPGRRPRFILDENLGLLPGAAHEVGRRLRCCRIRGHGPSPPLYDGPSMIGSAAAPVVDATRPRPWRDCPRDALAHVRGVFTDIDDTLTRDGAIEPAALLALHELHAAGVPVIAITGRPLGWSEPFARPSPEGWPVAAIVPENGAVALIRDAVGLHTEYVQDEATRAHNARRLREVAARVLADVPGATLARDSAGRVTDIAIDHAEFAHLDDAAIEQVVAIMRGHGMTATVSSIHVNGWFGDHDKLSGARWMVQRLYGRRLDDEHAQWVYVGDSTNDQAMFGFFPLSVGVANLRDFAAQLHTWPAYLTEGARGEGFAQVAARLIDARR